MYAYTPESPYESNQQQELLFRKKQRQARKKERVIALTTFLSLFCCVVFYLHLTDTPKEEFVVWSASSIALGQDVPYQESKPNAAQAAPPTEQPNTSEQTEEEPVQTQQESPQTVAPSENRQPAEPKREEPKKEVRKEEKENPKTEAPKEEKQADAQKENTQAATPAGKPEGQVEKKPDDNQLDGDKSSSGSGGDEVSMEGEQIWAGFDRGGMKADPSKQNGTLKYSITVDATGKIIAAQFMPQGSTRVSVDIQNHYREGLIKEGRMKLKEGKTPTEATYKGVLTIVLER
jgi:outer membrane biosynthesis protein TonB